MKKLWMLPLLTIGLLLSCEVKEEVISGLEKDKFVSEVNGKPTALYVLKNKTGMEVCVTNYGARVVSVMVPDRNGNMVDVVTGYDSIDDYTASNGVFGAVIGRYANRIANGGFVLDGVEYELPRNNGSNTLHGGSEGFQVQVWDAVKTKKNTLELTYLSKDGEMGFPGNLTIKVTYTVTDDNSLDIRYDATTDKPTVINVTNHSYFNLSGDAESQILDHLVMIDADYYTTGFRMDSGSEIVPVDSTHLDLRELTDIRSGFENPSFGRGYDHNLVLNTKGDITKLACKAISLESGIGMEVYTNEPGVQIYTGMSSEKGKFGVTYARNGALCLEVQHFPFSPNQPDFPSTVLRPGENFLSRCIYKFTVEK